MFLVGFSGVESQTFTRWTKLKPNAYIVNNKELDFGVRLGAGVTLQATKPRCKHPLRGQASGKLLGAGIVNGFESSLLTVRVFDPVPARLPNSGVRSAEIGAKVGCIGCTLSCKLNPRIT
jgi:hypothetical protein